MIDVYGQNNDLITVGFIQNELLMTPVKNTTHFATINIDYYIIDQNRISV